MRIDELARHIQAECTYDGATEISSCNTLEEAEPGQVSFLANPKYAGQLSTTRASAVVVAPNVKSDRLCLLKAKDPYYAFCQALVLLHGQRKHPHSGVHPRAFVDPTATVGQGTVIYPGAYVGPRVTIGQGCILYPNVTIYDDCVIGNRVTLHAGTVIGVDGFGYVTHKAEHHKIPQIGRAVIEDDVEIGANSVIDRGTMGDTVIGRGTKSSNLIAVGHNTRIGEHGLIVAQVGIAGSVQIGHHVTIAGQAGIAGHLKIGDKVTISAQAGVMNDIDSDSTVIGAPAMPAVHARRVYQLFTKLPELVERLKKLEAEQSQE